VVDECFEVFRASIRGVWRIKEDSVITPIPLAGKVGPRHDFNGGNAK